MFTDNKWIIRPKPNNKAKVRLFCLPYAGSSAVVTYKHFVDNLYDFIEVCPIELPGRGGRITENLICNLDLIVENILEAVKDFLEIPFAFFGHSMGGLISYEISRKINEVYGVQPFKLYISAHRAPFLAKNGLIMHKLNDEEFKNELEKMNGISAEIMQHQELMELVLPIIRNDYAACETYKFKDKKLLDIPITVFGGTNDKDISKEDLLAWQEVTGSDFSHFMIEGDHFFLVKEKEYFLNLFSKLIASDIQKYIKNQ